jgi:hypothetical protein
MRVYSRRRYLWHQRRASRVRSGRAGGLSGEPCADRKRDGWRNDIERRTRDHARRVLWLRHRSQPTTIRSYGLDLSVIIISDIFACKHCSGYRMRGPGLYIAGMSPDIAARIADRNGVVS